MLSYESTPEPPPLEAPRKPLFEASTQYRNWRFSPEQLARTRASKNAIAVANIRNTIEIESPGSSAMVSFLRPDEEQLLVRLYVSKIPQLCAMFTFPEEVEATASSYLKRFYLKNTVMDWHPRNVMLTALFLATKTTNHPISLESYVQHIPNTRQEDVLDIEFLVCQSLAFEFAIWHVHTALWGLWLEIQSIHDGSKDELREVYETAISHARSARLTDAEFIYTPSQIALACFSLASSTLAAQWARSKSAEAVLSIIEPIKDMITREGVVPDVEAVRAVDKRLKLCKNPAKVVGSKTYEAKKAEEERHAAEKRARKAEQARKAMEDDPFVDKPSGDQSVNVGVAVDAALEDDD